MDFSKYVQPSTRIFQGIQPTWTVTSLCQTTRTARVTTLSNNVEQRMRSFQRWNLLRSRAWVAANRTRTRRWWRWSPGWTSSRRSRTGPKTGKELKTGEVGWIPWESLRYIRKIHMHIYILYNYIYIYIYIYLNIIIHLYNKIWSGDMWWHLMTWSGIELIWIHDIFG